MSLTGFGLVAYLVFEEFANLELGKGNEGVP